MRWLIMIAVLVALAGCAMFGPMTEDEKETRNGMYYQSISEAILAGFSK